MGAGGRVMMRTAFENKKPAMFDENMAGKSLRRVMFVMFNN